ncbi:PKD domain-containing protein [Algoriphagus sp.]|uniref:PKD domain-containing protein n=1 Tax=Algoriphagus sp. TaxID=1872435 RepID=UPI003F6FCC54
MKNRLMYITFLLAIGGFFSCQPEEFELTEISYPFVTHSPLTINVDGEVSFGDGSRGVVTRIWSFPEGNVVSILGSESTTTSSEEIVHATFLKPGEYGVRLQVGFKDPQVTLDTTLNVTVLDNITASFSSSLEPQDGQVTIRAGESINYTSTSSGAPDSYQWTLEGGTPASSSAASASAEYNVVGSYDVMLIAYRNSPASRDTVLMRDYVRVIE